MTILIFGSTGFLGSHLIPKIASSNLDHVALSSKDGNLERFENVRSLLEFYKPEIVVNLAAYSGGIGANRKYPADFYYRNSLITAHVYEAAAKVGCVRKIIYPIGGCSYPASATSPINEEQLWGGFPHEASAAYSTAKMMGTVAATAYEKQYGISSQLLIPGNMYGEFDNFSLEDAHVVPALIRKFFEASKSAASSVVTWGSGIAKRDFVYAGDVAEVTLQLIVSRQIYPIMNISTGTTTSIRELVETISAVAGFDGEIVWDKDKGDGQLVKIFDTRRMERLGFCCSTAIDFGIKRTYDWYSANWSEARN